MKWIFIFVFHTRPLLLLAFRRLCFRPVGRSIPIVSKLDYTHPAYNGTTNCGVGEVSWNTVAASPFAKDVSVNDWTELSGLLDRLRQEPDDYINRLQVGCGKKDRSFSGRFLW